MDRRPAIIVFALAFSSAVSLLLAASIDEEKFIGARRKFWSFQKPVRPDVPRIGSPWIRTPIDAFILEALREKKIEPSPPATKEQLIRRVTLDLTGLPPTPGQVDLFLRDTSPNAYEKLVDRLLASPHYGERWAMRWLDVVRYADTNGYEVDAERPHAWRYRDYVVRSFNANKPFDRFVKEQIAGDELYPGDTDALIATGFHRAGPIHLVAGNQDEEMNRQEVLVEMTAGVSSAFLGLTMNCARCHNHKFDPILQSDYYRLQAIFAATEGQDINIASAEEKARYEEEKKAYQARLKPVQDQIKAIEKPYADAIVAEKKARLDEAHRVALETPKDKRTPEQQILAKEAAKQVEAVWDEVLARIPPAEKERRAALRRQLHEIELTEPEPPATAFAVKNLEKAPPTYLLKIGDHRHKMGEVQPGLPKVLGGDAPYPAGAQGRRSALAEWIASPEHPLTARVMVNRIWQFRMGTGLVATPNDFGAVGSRPTNKALLDWLAAEFVARGWSVKAMDRLIVLSSVYQQSASRDPRKTSIDPDNKLYWRMNKRRLEGEAIRDSILMVAGTINPRMGGRPVRVPIEKEIYDIIFTEFEPDNLWPLLPDKYEHNRRSLYLLNKRTVRLPLLANFDQPDTMTSCPQRPTSTHALQALNLMNSDFLKEQSQAFAVRLRSECGSDGRCQVNRAYRHALGRAPRVSEQQMATGFFRDGGTLDEFCLALLNRNEFVYVP